MALGVHFQGLCVPLVTFGVDEKSLLRAGLGRRKQSCLSTYATLPRSGHMLAEAAIWIHLARHAAKPPLSRVFGRGASDLGPADGVQFGRIKVVACCAGGNKHNVSARAAQGYCPRLGVCAQTAQCALIPTPCTHHSRAKSPQTCKIAQGRGA